MDCYKLGLFCFFHTNNHTQLVLLRQVCMFIIEVLGQRWVASVCFVASKIKEAVKSWPLGKSWCSICIPFMTIQGGDKLPMKAVLNECAEHGTAESVLTLVTRVHPCMPKRVILSCWIQTAPFNCRALSDVFLHSCISCTILKHARIHKFIENVVKVM